MNIEDLYKLRKSEVMNTYIQDSQRLARDITSYTDAPDMITIKITELDHIMELYLRRIEFLDIIYSLKIPREIAETLFPHYYDVNMFHINSKGKAYHLHSLSFGCILDGRKFTFTTDAKTYLDGRKKATTEICSGDDEVFIKFEAGRDGKMYLHSDCLKENLRRLELQSYYAYFLTDLLSESFDGVFDIQEQQEEDYDY